ncbi:DEAD/DEAH box helicase [Ordospora pajunii]|uniref:DEAD/DEAH box helicase n=1 Tax=Ordospora pajunii TaxID=3039483 RepID=UPI0029527AD2|nr:DEAD/DEAH box helicase [Ordospora pajunii]KAH9411378.1 DEAD/DEAH box helicase [Ordospora pajunii]
MEFSSLTIDNSIKKGLREHGFVGMTEIQQKIIPVGLEGSDVIGSSQTGSGKTLAFVVPMLHRLKELRWNTQDGLGCLVVTPTRELALQIFDVLSKVGKHAGFSMGLIMGGMEVESEPEKVCGVNILVCTPGRLIQHLQENTHMSTGNVQILVLDEADKMIEMGFRESLVSILGHLPRKKQVMLFSATPKASVARILELDDPKIVCVYREEGFPSRLQQYFYMMRIKDKVNNLYAFLKKNADIKAVVFFSTCKEVKFHHLLFGRLKVRSKIFCLSGGMTQKQRIEVFTRFVNEKNGYLFCTDLGSRGLDFPNVDAVLQYDCPCNIETYVHRVGRTARNNNEGKSYLYLVHGEERILSDIQKRGWVQKDKDSESKGKSTAMLDDISEGPRMEVNPIDRNVQGIIKHSAEISEYCKKYLVTYERFISMSSRKYSDCVIQKMPSLYSYFGIERDAKHKSREEDSE